MNHNDLRNDSSPLAAPPEAWSPMVRLAALAARPLDRFFKIEAASGILLLLSAAAALIWANSPWSHAYEELWHTPLGFHLGGFAFERPLEWFVNDVLMAIFFFVVGMEIRREIHDGELSDLRRAALPLVGALGGMVVPALLYLSLAGSGESRPGWGVPMATDIAFAVGVLALLGKRIPSSLRVLLLALAVIDDLGAILVIAFFYSSGVSAGGLFAAAGGVLGILALRAMGVRRFGAYVAPGVIVWAGVYSAGVHPTIAGVIIGLLTPVKAWLGAEGFVDAARHQAQRVSEELSRSGPVSARGANINKPLHRVAMASREAVSPAEFLIEELHPLVAYVIMPLFALANAGVNMQGMSFSATGFRVSLAVCVALVVGKPLGIIAVSVFAVWARISVLPSGLAFRHVLVLGVVAGIGFTMSLFIAQLAFDSPELLSAAKLGVLAASGVAMLLSVAVGALILEAPKDDAASTSPEPPPDAVVG